MDHLAQLLICFLKACELTLPYTVSTTLTDLSGRVSSENGSSADIGLHSLLSYKPVRRRGENHVDLVMKEQLSAGPEMTPAVNEYFSHFAQKQKQTEHVKPGCVV